MRALLPKLRHGSRQASQSALTSPADNANVENAERNENPRNPGNVGKAGKAGNAASAGGAANSHGGTAAAGSANPPRTSLLTSRPATAPSSGGRQRRQQQAKSRNSEAHTRSNSQDSAAADPVAEDSPAASQGWPFSAASNAAASKAAAAAAAAAAADASPNVLLLDEAQQDEQKEQGQKQHHEQQQLEQEEQLHEQKKNPSFAGLPEDVWVKVLQLLKPADLTAIRGSCRSLYQLAVRAHPSVSIRLPPKRSSDFPSFLARAGPSLSSLTVLPTAQLPATCLVPIGQHCPGLETLNLTDQKGVTDGVLVEVGGGCVRLKCLKVKVHHAKLTQGLEAVAARCRLLETLSLPTQVRESSLGPLLSSFPRLTRLDLSWSTKLADPAFATVAASCPRLTHLDASFSQISPAGLASLGSHCPALQSLRVNACHALRPSQALPILSRCLSLQSLDLGQSPLLPDWVEGLIWGIQGEVVGGKSSCGGEDWTGPAAGSAPGGVAAPVPGAAAGAVAGSPIRRLPALRTLSAYFQANQIINAAWIESLTVACPSLRRISFGTTSRITLSPAAATTTTHSTVAASAADSSRAPHSAHTTGTAMPINSISTSSTPNSSITAANTDSGTNSPLSNPHSRIPAHLAPKRIQPPRSPGAFFSRLAALASPRPKSPDTRLGAGSAAAGAGAAGSGAAGSTAAGGTAAGGTAAGSTTAGAGAPGSTTAGGAAAGGTAAGAGAAGSTTAGGAAAGGSAAAWLSTSTPAAVLGPRITDAAAAAAPPPPLALPANAAPPAVPATAPPSLATTTAAATPPATTATHPTPANLPSKGPIQPPPLESLVLPCFGMSDAIIAVIAAACPALKSLRFDPGSKKRHAKLIGMFQVAGAPDIDCTMTDASLQSLAASCPSLSELHVFSDYLLGTGLSPHVPCVASPSSHIPSTSSSDSSSPPCNPSSSSSPSPPPSKPPHRFLSLKTLSIASCSLTDAGVACIVAACPNLLRLLLRDCIQVSEASVSSAVKACKKLQVLDVSGCTRINLKLAARIVSRPGPVLVTARKDSD
ncbi:hypothetical protein CLOM_g5919 [Closterium sp. NIES-68]|nr:hypothetical protein CLOM_g5919 [Closterium sp. NIES-68]GJP63254.1 hypothetical protein CLOP_g20314 [Closterium sp. NIES-67]